MAVAVAEEGLSKKCKVWHEAAGVDLSIALAVSLRRELRESGRGLHLIHAVVSRQSTRKFAMVRLMLDHAATQLDSVIWTRLPRREACEGLTRGGSQSREQFAGPWGCFDQDESAHLL